MWCGVKWAANHACVKSQLYQLLINNKDSNEEEPEVFSDCVEHIEEMVNKEEEGATLHTISLQAYWGTENCQTNETAG